MIFKKVHILRAKRKLQSQDQNILKVNHQKVGRQCVISLFSVLGPFLPIPKSLHCPVNDGRPRNPVLIGADST